MTNVKNLNNKDLIAKIKFLVAQEKKNVAAQIVILKEVRKRKLAIDLGYPSLLEFCVEELGLTRDQAWKRSQAAGAVEKEPILLDMLNKGQTSISTLAVISPKLSEKTSEEIRSFVPNKTKREVEAFVSNLNRDGTRSKRKQTIRVALDIEPKTLEKLEHARKLLMQNRAELSREDVLDMALELLLDKKDPVRKAERAKKRIEKKEGAQKKAAAGCIANKMKSISDETAPGQSNDSKEQSNRYIPAGIRHKVICRSDHQCEYVGSSGKRCKETRDLQLDHVKMYCHGGKHSPDNLRLTCTSHNRYLAERALGRSYVS